jgi:hypothetical protein
VRLTKSRAFTYDAATGSVGYFMSINMRHELTTIWDGSLVTDPALTTTLQATIEH